MSVIFITPYRADAHEIAEEVRLQVEEPAPAKWVHCAERGGWGDLLFVAARSGVDVGGS